MTEQPESVKLFMRPTEVFKGAFIELWTDSQEVPLARFRRSRLTPGEMVVLTVQGGVFAAAETDVMIGVNVS